MTDKWRKLSDEKPEHQQLILITNGKVVTASQYWEWPPGDRLRYGLSPFKVHGIYADDWEWDFDEKTITHWMPLPEPPQSVSQ